MTPYFVDTGYLIGLEVADDQHHEAAREHWRGLIPTRPRLVTTTFVLSETATFLNVNGAHEKAVEIVTRIRSSRSFEVVSVTEDLWERAWDYFAARDDKSYSMTDCVSFVLMQDRGLTVALTFDRHFRQAGFQTEPIEP